MRWTDNFGSRTLPLAGGAVLLLSLGAPPAAVGAQKSAQTLYEEALTAEKMLFSSKDLQDKKDSWLKVARQYHLVVLNHPRSGYCDDALFHEGELYRKAGVRFGDREAMRRGLDAYHLILEGYPSSKWCPAARMARADLNLNYLSDEKAARAEIADLLERWPKSAEAAEARGILQDLDRPATTVASTERSVSSSASGVAHAADRRVEVSNIRQWSGKDYTRIVIDTAREVAFRRGRLTQPDRIYFDLLNTHLSESLANQTFPVGDGFLRQIRVGQNKPDVVRVVLDFESISRYNVFSLPDPHRLVVDILGIEPEPAIPAPRTVPTPTAPPQDPPIPTSSDALASATLDSEPAAPAPTAAEMPPDPQPASADLIPLPDIVLPLPAEPTSDGRFPISRQLGLGARRVIIDPGHGGHDPGAQAGGLREKDLVLDISRRVAKILEDENTYEVILTRSTDIFIPLEERTAIANSKEADLFVSIHANSSRNRRARGLETYYLNLATTPEAEQTAARENAVSTRRMTELQELLSQIMNNSKIAESKEFAHHVHGSMVKRAVASDSHSRDLGVKTAPFYVLLGANMPSVLLEVSFVSNADDAKLLSSDDFRQKIAQSIADGIKNYTTSLKGETHVAATPSSPPPAGQDGGR
ncbi:MAG: N-acetylmuramoyl-L-alanine amidase [Vicinamibacteria bacterium]